MKYRKLIICLCAILLVILTVLGAAFIPILLQPSGRDGYRSLPEAVSRDGNMEGVSGGTYKDAEKNAGKGPEETESGTAEEKTVDERGITSGKTGKAEDIKEIRETVDTAEKEKSGGKTHTGFSSEAGHQEEAGNRAEGKYDHFQENSVTGGQNIKEIIGFLPGDISEQQIDEILSLFEELPGEDKNAIIKILEKTDIKRVGEIISTGFGEKEINELKEYLRAQLDEDEYQKAKELVVKYVSLFTGE